MFTIKTDKQGNFLKAKARWVLRGFEDKQKEYQQTDSPASTRPGFRMSCQIHPPYIAARLKILNQECALEEIPIERNTKEDPQCTSAMHTKYRSLLRQINWLQSWTQFQCCYKFCAEEVIVQGDEGPVRRVAHVVDCHGVTVGHEEREEEKERQEVESDEEKTLKERCACPWMG